MEKLQQIADYTLGFLASYVVTSWITLRHPLEKLPYLISSEDEKTKDRMPPFAFLVVNILIVFAIRKMFDFSLPRFPFQLPWDLNFPLALLSYLLGPLVLSFFLLLFVSRRDFPHGLRRIVPVVCYASVVYLPLSLVGMLVSQVFGGFVLAPWASLPHGRPPEFPMFYFIALLGLLFLYIVGLIWWLYLLHLGMQSVNLHVPYNGRWKRVLSAFVCFFSIKVVYLVLGGFLYYGDLIRTEFRWQELKRVISASPPGCAKALVLAEQISANNQFPIYPRYAAQIISATCLPVVFLPNEVEAKEIMRAIAAVRKSEYKEARGILEEYFTELAKSKAGERKILDKLARIQLENADRLYQSPQFIKLELLEYKNIYYYFPEAPIALFP